MLTADVIWVGKRTGLWTLRLTLHLQHAFQDSFHQGLGPGPGQEKNVYYIFLRFGFCRNPNFVVANLFYDFWVDMNKLGPLGTIPSSIVILI